MHDVFIGFKISHLTILSMYKHAIDDILTTTFLLVPF